MKEYFLKACVIALLVQNSHKPSSKIKSSDEYL